MTIEEMKKIKVVLMPERGSGKNITKLYLSFKHACSLLKEQQKISPYIYKRREENETD